MKKLILLIPILAIILSGCSLTKTSEYSLNEAIAEKQIHDILIEQDRIAIEKCDSVNSEHFRSSSGFIYCGKSK